uniref:C3H1-type domain-containing protein n=1 Tax=Hyaloperonospora arabidopsidis (strain Emoy2) TaxID=559515 RepID=M4BTR1_HYAAE
MEFAPTRGLATSTTAATSATLDRTDALSYTDETDEIDEHGGTQDRGPLPARRLRSKSSAPHSSLSFGSSNLFRFDSARDFFAPVKYSEGELTAASSPTESGDESYSKDAGLLLSSTSGSGVATTSADVTSATTSATSDAQDPGLSPSLLDQKSGSKKDNDLDVGIEDTDQSRNGTRTMDCRVRKVRSEMDMLPLPALGRRKNSIEMFLSQSPSQALGGDFLKLSLSDRQRSEEANERAANGGSGDTRSRPNAASGVNPYASGQFQLNPVQKMPNGYTSTGGRYRHGQLLPPAATQPQERYRSSSRSAPPTSLSLSRSNTVPETTSSTAGVAYSSAYALSVQLPSEDSWSGGQQENSNVPYQEQMQEYYDNNQMAASYEQQQFCQQQQQQQQQHYRSLQAVNVAYNYGGTPSRAQMNPAQWNPMVVGPHPPPSGMYDISGNMYVIPRSSPSRHPYAQMGYGSQKQSPRGMRGGTSRAQGRSMYGRITPPLPDSSPPHSPRKGMGMGGGMQLGMKQCKFFIQGYCRMGSKCKFVHQSGASTPEHMGGVHNLNRQNGPMMYQQSRMMMMSPPPSHMMQQQQRHPINGDDFGNQVNVPFGARQQSRLSYRSENATASSMSLGLMDDMVMSAPIMSGSATDSSSLSAAALSVEDIQNRVFAMSKDQNGCRLLQEQLDYEDRSDLCEVIYQESLEHLAEMMVDPFGNYLFQKLLERVNEKQRLVIIRRVGSNLVAAALNLHGTRSVQKVVEVCAISSDVIEEEYDDGDDDVNSNYGEDRREVSEQRRATSLSDVIVEALKDDAVRLCIDSNGNHVIQRALQYLKPEYNQFVFDAVCKECTTVGTHRHGCCVLQRCLDAANKAQKAEVIEQVERQAMKLMQDPYGNYVVQYVLDSCTAEEAFGVITKPLGHIYELSVQKFSSNVIEKCLEKAPERVRQKYIAEITSCPKMNKMLQDQFANYVVQRALCVCAEEQCLLLVKAIRPHLAAMRNTSGGRRITARILKRFPNMDISVDMGMSPTADCLFNNGVNGMTIGHLPSSSTGNYMQQQHLQSSPMYSMQGGHMSTFHHYQGGSRGNRMPPLHGSDGSMLTLTDVGGMSVNGTSRA